MRTFWRPVKSGWNPMPSSRRAATCPTICTCPVVGWIVPVISLSRVLFPAPLTPMMPIASPGCTLKERFCKTHRKWCLGLLKGTSHSSMRDHLVGYWRYPLPNCVTAMEPIIIHPRFLVHASDTAAYQRNKAERPPQSSATGYPIVVERPVRRSSDRPQ